MDPSPEISAATEIKSDSLRTQHFTRRRQALGRLDYDVNLRVNKNVADSRKIRKETPLPRSDWLRRDTKTPPASPRPRPLFSCSLNPLSLF